MWKQFSSWSSFLKFCKQCCNFALSKIYRQILGVPNILQKWGLECLPQSNIIAPKFLLMVILYALLINFIHMEKRYETQKHGGFSQEEICIQMQWKKNVISVSWWESQHEETLLGNRDYERTFLVALERDKQTETVVLYKSSRVWYHTKLQTGYTENLNIS